MLLVGLPSRLTRQGMCTRKAKKRKFASRFKSEEIVHLRFWRAMRMVSCCLSPDSAHSASRIDSSRGRLQSLLSFQSHQNALWSVFHGGHWTSSIRV